MGKKQAVQTWSQVKVRPETRQALKQLAASWGMTMEQAAARLVSEARAREAVPAPAGQ